MSTKECSEYRGDLVAFVDGELDEERTSQIASHLPTCPACSLAVAELRAVSEQLGAWQVPESRPAWEEETEQAIRKRASRRGFWGFVLRPAFAWSMAAGLFLAVVSVAIFSVTDMKYASDESTPRLKGAPENSAKLYQRRNMVEFDEGKRDWEQRNQQAEKLTIETPEAGLIGNSKTGYGYSSDMTGSYGGLAAQSSPQSSVHIGDEGVGDLKAGRYNIRLQTGERSAAVSDFQRVADPNAYYESNYQGGRGDRERVEKLIAEGVLVDGKKLKLETFTRRYTKNLKVPSRTALAVSALTDVGTVHTSGGEVFMQVGIQATEREMARRPPLNIALVIDRSGSMAAGNKMPSARKAALRFVDALHPDDRITVIAYNDRITTRSEIPKRSLKMFIKSLKPAGSTNIHGALDTAYRAVARGHSEGMLNAVILLSDGLPTAGNTSVPAIVGLSRTAAEHSISTTTVGMGLDYNDALMMGVARQGQGHYHFVKDASSIEPILKSEFESLNRVVARALRLRIKLADDVVLKRVLGSKQLGRRETARVRAEEKHIDRRLYHELGIQPDRDVDDEEGIKMLIPYFFSGDSHVVMLQLQVPPGEKRRRIAQVTLKYKDLVFARNGFDERDAVISRSDDADALVASISRPVKKNLLGMRAGEALLAASELVNRGDFQRAARMLSEQAYMFEQAARAWSDDELSEDAWLLRRYTRVIVSLDNPALAGREDLRSYLAKTMSHSGYRLVQ